MIVPDLRTFSRTIRNAPGFLLLAILTLGLGIGGTTAMYSFVSGVLLEPLPFDDPETLVVITRNNRAQGFAGMLFPARDVRAFREQARSFSRLSGYSGERVILTGAEDPENVRGARILPDFLSLLGNAPSIGRGFEVEEHETSAPVVILGHGLWERRFGGGADIIGRSLRVDGKEHTVVGVLPPGDDVVPTRFDVLRPMAVAELEGESAPFVWVVARRLPGISLAAAREDVNAILERWEKENRPPVLGWRADVETLREHLVGRLERPLWVLFGAVGMVLLLACSNVASLLLARSAERARELAIRAAIGAARWQIARQLLVESVLLSLVGGLLGVILAFFGTKLLVALAPFDVPRLARVGVDARVLLFSASASIGTGVLVGLIPVLALSRQDLDRSLRATAQAVSSQLHRRRFRNVLAVAQLGLALTLSIGAGLMIRSFARLVSVDPGFETGGLLTFQLSLPSYRFSESARWDAVAEQVLERVSTVPGVRSAAASTWTPLSGAWGRAQMSVESTSGEIVEREQWPMVLGVTPGYFQSLGLPLLRGRELTLADGDSEDGVVLVNRELAEQAWPEDDPLGKRLKFGGAASTNPWLTVVGVVEDARLIGLEHEGQEAMFRPLLRTGRTLADLQMLVRTSTNPERLVPQIREAVWAVDDQLPIRDVQTMDELVSINVSRPWFHLVVIAIFAVTALTLAGVGTYGVLSHSVTQRSREMGLRMALGATRSAVLELVLRQGMGLVTAGVFVGLGLAIGLTRVLGSLLYEISATEPVTFVGAAVVLGIIGLAATLVPALRATRVDPMTALRTE
ncbi:MAG TPA: ABC transporter permease [Vicinamibacteria bacterium]|nr:ABC transporter permease [Vicinamibacteria bacterium]